MAQTPDCLDNVNLLLAYVHLNRRKAKPPNQGQRLHCGEELRISPHADQ